jgi:hypothetical protein
MNTSIGQSPKLVINATPLTPNVPLVITNGNAQTVLENGFQMETHVTLQELRIVRFLIVKEETSAKNVINTTHPMMKLLSVSTVILFQLDALLVIPNTIWLITVSHVLETCLITDNASLKAVTTSLLMRMDITLTLQDASTAHQDGDTMPMKQTVSDVITTSITGIAALIVQLATVESQLTVLNVKETKNGLKNQVNTLFISADTIKLITVNTNQLTALTAIDVQMDSGGTIAQILDEEPATHVVLKNVTDVKANGSEMISFPSALTAQILTLL